MLGFKLIQCNELHNEEGYTNQRIILFLEIRSI